MVKETLQARRDIPQTLTLKPPKPYQSSTLQQPSSASSSSSSILTSSSTTRAGGGGGLSVPDSLAGAHLSRSLDHRLVERGMTTATSLQHIPTPSPTFSDSAASTYENPLTPFSAKFNFPQHISPFFNGTISGGELTDGSSVASVGATAQFEEESSSDSLPRPCSFGDLVMSVNALNSDSQLNGSSMFGKSSSTTRTHAGLGDDDNDFEITSSTDNVLSAPFHLASAMRMRGERQRIASSNDSYNGEQDSSSDFSPNASVASVRVARIVQRSDATHLVSQSFEQQSLDSPASPVPVLLEDEWISGSIPLASGLTVSASEPVSADLTHHPFARPLSDVSVYSNMEREATLASETEASISSEKDALARMRSILGPKTRIISPAPWDDDFITADAAKSESKPRAERKSGTNKTPGSPSKENAGIKSKLGSRSRSFSMLTTKKASPSPEETKESDAALKQLVRGIGSLEAPSVTSSSPKKKAAPPIPVITKFTSMNSTDSDDISALSLSTAARRKIAGDNKDPVMLTVSTSLSPSTLARSAPADIAAFVTGGESKDEGSPLVDDLNKATSALTIKTDNLSTPTSPTASKIDSSSASEAILSPGAGSTKRFKLISLDEARRREHERSAADSLAIRQANGSSTSNAFDHIPSPSTSSWQTNGPRASMMSPVLRDSSSLAPGSLSSSKTLKNRKSGFLKRMMGGGEKFDATPKVPSPSLPLELPTDAASETRKLSASSSQFSRSPSVQTITSDNVYPSGLASAGSLLRSSLMPKNTGMSAVSSAPPARIAFGSTPIPDPEHRIRHGKSPATTTAIPSLSLRPVSMAFSAGLPMDFMTSEQEEVEGLEDEQLATVTTPTSMTATEPSPFAHSFESATAAVSSLFETAPTTPATISPVMTPVTPQFPPTPTESMFSPQQANHDNVDDDDIPLQFAAMKKQWVEEKAHLVRTIDALKSQLQAPLACPHCGESFARACSRTLNNPPATPSGTSIIDRPRILSPASSGSSRVLF